MLVHLIADFGGGDLAFAEVAQRIKLYLPEATIIPTSVPPFATLAAGFMVAQLGLNPAPKGTLIFHNVAPRKDDLDKRRDNDGERLVFAELSGGTQVVGVHAGYALSFVRDAATRLAFVNCPARGSQFRSRDIFPQAFARAVRGEPDALAGALAPGSIPDIPASRVAYIDGFGNIKTTLTYPLEQGLHEGDTVTVTIGKRSRKAVLTGGSFSVPQGQLALSQGSSGWHVGHEEIRFAELFLRGGSAARHFGHPSLNEPLHMTNS